MRAPTLFKTPWEIVEHRESFEVRDAAGHALAYTYYEDEPTRRSVMNRMTKDEARRMAVAISLIPERQAKLKALEDGLG